MVKAEPVDCDSSLPSVVKAEPTDWGSRVEQEELEERRMSESCRYVKMKFFSLRKYHIGSLAVDRVKQIGRIPVEKKYRFCQIHGIVCLRKRCDHGFIKYETFCFAFKKQQHPFIGRSNGWEAEEKVSTFT